MPDSARASLYLILPVTDVPRQVFTLDLTLEGEPVGEEFVVLDAADAGIGDIVLLNNDGGSAKMVTGDDRMIASMTVCGVVDHYTWRGKTVYCH